MMLRKEYPRPQFQRKEWKSLNGLWEFCFDDNNDGIKEKYYLGEKKFDLKINVPFTYQYEESGINDSTIHDILWYKKTFNIDEMLGKNCLLCFNGVDYLADIYLNGHHLLSHEGGYSPFEIDITKYVKKGDNVLILRIYDPQKSDNPRGKQTWKGKNFECFYLPNSGIWQSVWIETFENDYIKVRSLFTDIDKKEVFGEVENAYMTADKVEIFVYDKQDNLVTSTVAEFSNYGKTKYSLSIENMNLWELDNPYLYNIEYRLFSNGKLCDKAYSRFGMKKFEIEDGIIKLNHKPCYQRLILDQGYWKESGITPPSINHLKEDILLAKEMGFNGARKHQKIEDPYWYYYAEELGFLTWCEMPSAYEFCTTEASNFIKQWTDILINNRNFTSIVTYVPLNESWGVGKIYSDEAQQNLARTMYYICKTFAPYTIVSINDGWENPKESDIVTAHDYCKEGKTIVQYFKDVEPSYIPSPRRYVMCENNLYQGQPVLFSEFGGVMLNKDASGDNWGYGDNAKDDEEIYQRIESLIDGIKACNFQGFCYTQLTDVQQEVNGLLNHNHKNKFNNKKLKEIFTK